MQGSKLRDKDLPDWLSPKMLNAEGTSNSDMESTHYGFPSPDVEEEAPGSPVNEWKQDAWGLHLPVEAS